MEQLKVVRGGRWFDASQVAVAKWLRGLSLTQHLLLMALTPLPLVSVAILVPYFLDYRSLQDAAAHERGLAIVRLLAPAAEFGVAIRSAMHLNHLVETVLAQGDVASVVIYDRAGEVIVQGGHPDIAVAGQIVSATRARFMLAENGRMSFAAPVNSQPAALDDIANANMLARDTPGVPNKVGWVYVELDTHALALHEYGVMGVSAALALVALAVSAGIALRLAHVVGDPVARLADAVRRMTAGDVDTSVPVDAACLELQTLQDGFNTLGRSIASVRQTMQTRIDETVGVLAYQAQHDPLTGLANRRAFEEALEEAVLASRRASDQSSLCFMDLDHFKEVNDLGGHAAGDALLCQIANLIQQRVRSCDLVCRIGGDEFALILRACTRDDAKRIAMALCEAIADLHFQWEGMGFDVSASFGVAHIDDGLNSTTALCKAADSACYAAKRNGRNQVVEHQETQDNPEPPC